VRDLRQRVHLLVEDALLAGDGGVPVGASSTGRDLIELLIVDEADRLRLAGLEQLRDSYDRGGIGLILIGMPGLERRMARYPQLYSRVGFVHQYRPLSGDELRFILAHKWEQLGLTLDPSDYTDAEALAAITSITGGNFRLIQRLFTQIERILAINGLHTISGEVVMAARQTLVIGEA
jgi:DNA transposition AAA+ family ATPase